MTQLAAYRTGPLAVVDLLGRDAGLIASNLTTNDVKSLPPEVGCETFVTDVRGKTLGHFLAYRIDNGFRLIGAGGQSERFAEHADRYTIREDAQPHLRDDDFVAVAVPGESAEALRRAQADAPAVATDWRLRMLAQHVDPAFEVYEVPWLGEGGLLVLMAASQGDAVLALLGSQGYELSSEGEFHQRRTLAGFPWFGIDLDESNLPQEADRDPQSICLTKGCYLGQETVARLDALGKVQRKLVRWSIQDLTPAPGSTLESDGKTVGRLTSVAGVSASDNGGVVAEAIGFARRSHFEPGAFASGTDAATGQPFHGRVR